MAESSLSVSLSTLAAEVAYFLGFGRTPANWSGWQAASPYVASTLDSQLGDILAVIAHGLRAFYTPPPTDAQSPPHRWSFLSPEAVLTTASGVTDYPLPDDFAGFEGEMTYPQAQNLCVVVKRTGVGRVRRLLQQGGGVTSAPTECAEVPLPFDGATGQRYAAAFYPTPDQAYALKYQYNRQPQMLSAQQPFPWGGQQYAEVILAACLAAAELHQMDQPGPRAQDFQLRLAAAVAADARDHRPEQLGYNGDRSDGRDRYPGYDLWGPHTWSDSVTYNGASMG